MNSNTHHYYKLISPVLPPGVLHRPKLVAILNEAVGDKTQPQTRSPVGYKLILIRAPAGYGKTTLLADFARHTSMPYCWYTLDQSDENESTFLTMLIASIRQQFPRFGTELDVQLSGAVTISDQEPVRQRFEAVVDGLTSAIADEIPVRFALILCDYHEVSQNQAINALLNRFLHHLPPQCVLFLESRTISNLDFVSLLAHRQVIGLGSSDLRFSKEEILAIARLQGVGLTQDEATLLEQSFEGWITGILLGTRLGDLRQAALTGSVDKMGGRPAIKVEREYLFNYLAREVFTRDKEAYTFLKEACVLRQMTPDLCSALLDLPDASQCLAYLEQQGLFVTRYDTGTKPYYICHPVLRDLFYKDLKMHNPARLNELHRRACALFRGHQDDEAIFHALATQDFEMAAELISRICRQQFAEGHLITLARWIDVLPEEIVSRHPQILLIRAQIFLEASELEQVQSLLDRAQTALQWTPESSSLLTEVYLAHAMLLMQQGEYARARELAQQALVMLPADKRALRANAHQLLGSCAAYFNDFTTSITELQQALQILGYTTGTRQVAKLHTMLANFYGIIGNNPLSEHHRTRAIQCWDRLNDEWGRIDNLIGLGSTRQRQGRLLEAEQVYIKALEASRRIAHYPCGEAYALANLGDLYQAQEQYQTALPLYEDGLNLARQLHDTYLENYILCQLATTYLLMEDTPTALKLLAQFKGALPQPGAIQENEQGFYALAMGMVQLRTSHYDEAYVYLSTAEKFFAEAKAEQIQATLRLAACLLAQDETEAAKQRAEAAIAQAQQYGYEHLVEVELKRNPALHSVLNVDEQSHFPEKSPLPADESTSESTALGAASSSSSSAAPATSLAHLTNPPLSLRILALGEPTVLINDQPIRRWRMARSMELFFLLLNAEHPLHKEQIILALWPEADEQIDQTLRSTLHYLRKALGASSIVSRAGMYSLNLVAVYHEHVWYDVKVFLGLYALAQAAQAEENLQGARDFFEHMTSLYRGDYLQSFYSDWCTMRREELRQAYMDAHWQLALIAWQQEQLEKSIYHWQHLLAMDNCLEAAHEGLMHCYVRQGKRTMALRQYQRCVEALHQELDVSPGPTLQQLYQRIIDETS